MNSIEKPKIIGLIISSFYRLGLWHRGPTVKETRMKIVYSIYHFLFPISIVAGVTNTSGFKDEFIFLVEEAIMVTVLSVKLLYIIWKKNEICKLVHRVCVHSIEDDKVFGVVNNVLKKFDKFITVFVSLSSFIAICATLVVPFLGNERKLFVNIGFPLDWKNDNFSFWLAFTFFFTEVLLTLIAFLFSVLIWYLMFNCALRYQILGYQIKNMGARRTVDVGEIVSKRKMTRAEKEKIFRRDLITAIQSHQQMEETTDQLHSFLSTQFQIQIATSGVCICGSIYCLVFSMSDNVMEYLIFVAILVFNVFDIFMIMFFGNEIALSTDRLAYCLFEADWVDQSQSIKKCIIIFGEFLRQPHELVILKLYPLTLETFTRILNSAYSMFNILQNFK